MFIGLRPQEEKDVANHGQKDPLGPFGCYFQQPKISLTKYRFKLQITLVENKNW